MALILPSSAVVTNTTKEKEVDPLWVGRERIDIDEAKTWSMVNKPLPLMNGENIQISGWTEGDDRRPAITKVSDGSVFVTGGGFNPVLTIMAIGYWVGDYIAKNWNGSKFK